MSLGAQGRASGNSRVSPVVRHQQRNLTCSRIYAPAGKAIPDLDKERLEYRSNAAAHHQNIWIEQVDNVAQPNG
jgi:hypothetical protein